MVGLVLRHRQTPGSDLKRPILIGFAVAILATAVLLAAVLTDAFPFTVVAAVGAVGMALLVVNDLWGRDGVRSRNKQAPRPKVAHVKQNNNHVEHAPKR